MTTGQHALKPCRTMERIPILQMGNLLLVTIQVDMHDQMAMELQDDLTSEDRENRGPRRSDRHLRARHGGLLYRPDDRRISGMSRFSTHEPSW